MSYDDIQIKFRRFCTTPENDIWLCHECYDEQGNTNASVAEYIQSEYPGEPAPCGEWVETKTNDDDTYDLTCGVCGATGAEFQEDLYADDDEMLESADDLETKWRQLNRRF